MTRKALQKKIKDLTLEWRRAYQDDASNEEELFKKLNELKDKYDRMEMNTE